MLGNFGDGRNVSADIRHSRALKSKRLVVMHDGDDASPRKRQPHVVEATRRLIPELRSRGFRFARSATFASSGDMIRDVVAPLMFPSRSSYRTGPPSLRRVRRHPFPDFIATTRPSDSPASVGHDYGRPSSLTYSPSRDARASQVTGSSCSKRAVVRDPAERAALMRRGPGLRRRLQVPKHPQRSGQ